MYSVWQWTQRLKETNKQDVEKWTHAQVVPDYYISEEDNRRSDREEKGDWK